MIEKKRVKQWGKIRLFETSCCGIPAYPSAHKSYSLIKALTTADLYGEEPSDQLNIKENQNMPEEKVATEPEKPVEAPEAEAEKPAEAKPEVEAEKPAEEVTEKAINVESMTTILAKALTIAIEKSATQRGLVSPEEKVESMREELSKKSMGELAIGMGLFKGGGSSVREF